MLFSAVAATVFLALLPAVARASLQIVPGASWTSPSTGNHIQAHGEGLIEVDGTFYMTGENKTAGSAFQSVACYSSKDLVTWDLAGNLLTVQSAAGDLGPNRVLERPKIIFNEASNQYVMWMHIDDSSYAEAKTGVAVSPTVCGEYTYLGSFRPLGFQSRDMGLFKDDDGTAYLLTEDRVNGLRIDKLTDDYLNVTAATFLFEDLEAPAMVKKDGVYFIFASHLTGWDTNDNVYATATNIAGPWSDFKTFAPVGSDTFNSQTTFILPISEGFNVFMGDRWDSSNLGTSTYIWLPLTLSGTTASLPSSAAPWVPNVAAGTWSAAPASTTYQAEAGTMSNGAKSVSCSGCSGGTAAGFLGGSTDGTLVISSVSSNVATTSTLQIYYANGDSATRYATVTVNGASQRVAFVSTGSGQTVEPAVANVALKAGSGNTITISGVGTGWAPDVDRIVVPVS